MKRVEAANPESLNYRDPLGELRNEARKIANLALQKNQQVKITVLGTLHEEIPHSDIVKAISISDLTSLELPSIVVKAYQSGAAVKLGEESFWGKVLDSAKVSRGVNNNRAAVNGRRILDGTVTSEGKIPDSFPDISVSAQNMKFGNGEALEKAEIADSETLWEIQRQEIGFNNIYPSLASIVKDGIEHFIYVARPTQGKNVLSAALVSGNFMLPAEYFMMHGSEIFGDEVDGIAGADICKLTLNHLLRVRVDKTQIKGMLRELSSVMKNFPSGKSIEMVHLGGIDHNPNLLRILNEIFGPQNRIQILEGEDREASKSTSNESVFFDKHMSISEALLATKMYEDQVVINVSCTDRLLKNIFSENKDSLITFCKSKLLAE